jgi:dimethylamine/trimethylamine dehydrogenase
VHTGSRLDAEAVLAYGAELVVIASGARWAADGINGVTHTPLQGADASLPHVLTPEQIMLEGKNVADRVLVYDCEGFFVGTGLAERLARDGHEVTLVTPLAHPGAYMHLTGESPRLHRLLHDLHIRTVTERFLERIEPGGAATASVWIEEDRLELEADSFVLVTQRISNDELFRAVRRDPDAIREAGIEGVYRVGDCVAPRLIADAVFDGHRMGREIDSEDPQTPRPFIRERRLAGSTTDADYAAQLQS